MSSNLPQIIVNSPIGKVESPLVENGGGTGSLKTHERDKKSISSATSTTSSILGNPQSAAAALPTNTKKKPPMTSFKVEAEIVSTDSSRNVLLFENNDSLYNHSVDAATQDNADAASNFALHTADGSDTAQNSDSEETFVYDTPKMVDVLKGDEASSFVDSDRPILIHKNSIRSSFILNHNNNSQTRAFSQTVLPDNESVNSKKLLAQRRIPTLQQQQLQPHQNQRFVQSKIGVPASGSSFRPAIYSSSSTARLASDLHQLQAQAQAQAHMAQQQQQQLQSQHRDGYDQESFTSGEMTGSESVRHSLNDDDGDDEGDDTNTTLKLEKSFHGSHSPSKSIMEPLSMSSSKKESKSPAKASNARNLIVSQVRNVSKNLFENEKNYLKKKLSFDSLNEDDERSLILHNRHNDGSDDDDFQFYYHGNANNNNNNNNNNNSNIPNRGSSKSHSGNGGDSDHRHDGADSNYGDHWNSDFSYDKRYQKAQSNGHSKANGGGDYYYYPTYDSISPYNSVNPHNYVSKYKKQNIFLKFLFLMLKASVFLIIMFSISKIFIIKYVTNPLLNFQIDQLEKLIVTESLLIFDIECTCSNINLQDVIIDQSDVDVFITYENEEKIDKTLLLGNINKFFVPLTFDGLINNDKVPFMKTFNSSFVRSTTLSSSGQMKLSGNFKEINEDIELIVNGPFELNIRGSFKYKLPFGDSDSLISVSKKYVHNE